MIAILERDTVPCLPPVIEAPILKRCSCGAEYTREQWAALDYVGAQVDDVEALELPDLLGVQVDDGDRGVVVSGEAWRAKVRKAAAFPILLGEPEQAVPEHVEIAIAKMDLDDARIAVLAGLAMWAPIASAEPETSPKRPSAIAHVQVFVDAWNAIEEARGS